MVRVRTKQVRAESGSMVQNLFRMSLTNLIKSSRTLTDLIS